MVSFPEPNWGEVARNILQREKAVMPYLTPAPKGVMVRWKKRVYFGHIQEVASGYSKEIVALSKTSRPLVAPLVAAIRKADSRLELEADDSLDLAGRNHVLRKVNERLVVMTPEQTRYMLTHPIDVVEI